MKNKKKTELTLVLAGIFFLLLMLISFSWVKNLTKKNLPEKMTQKIVITPTPVHLGSMKLVTSSQKEIYAKNEQVRVVAYADSHNIPVGGYDIVLNFDPKKTEFIDSQNLVEDFQVFVSEKDGAIHLTSIKKKEVTTSIVFKDTPLVEFIFKPKSAEPIDFSIGFNQGASTDSNLLSEDVTDILTDVEGTSIFIGSNLLLQQGKEVVLSDKKTSLTLVEVTPLQARCADCMEYAKILVKKDGQEKTIEFKSGGVAGIVDLSKQEFGWKFEAETFGKNTLSLQVAILEK